jgi:CheY-like chemotaxis protein
METSFHSIFFPTRALILDDNEQFLDAAIASVSQSKVSYKVCIDPYAALNYINSVYKGRKWIDDYLSAQEEEEYQHKMLDLNVIDIHKKIYDQRRFETLTTIIVDYDMPMMSGKSFLEKISHIDIPKILFTGVADEKCAVDLFNRGMIDAFIIKEGYKSFKELGDICVRHQQEYLTKINKTIESFLLPAKTFSTLLTDKNYIAIVTNIIKEKGICEVYLLESYGSLLLVDKDGKVFLCFFQDEDMFESNLGLAEDEGVSLDIIGSLRNREKTFCFYEEETIIVPPEKGDWSKYLFESKTFKNEGGAIIYWALCDDHVAFSRKKILSYKSFLKRSLVDGF